VPVAAAAVWFLHRSREVGFFDPTDDSTRYRMTMWRDGIRLWTESARHFVFGVGMDSVRQRWQQWDLFDRGFMPLSHFHSMIVQLLVERGLPALLLWIAVLVSYLSILVRAIRKWSDGRTETVERVLAHGILLGCLGGTVGFCVSGLAQYNLGSQVTAMLFYFLMGLGVRTATLLGAAEPPSENSQT
jgi:O-antigen ligase